MDPITQYYWNNPVAMIDRNQWDVRHAEVALQFLNRSVYTPLVDWTNEPMSTGAAGTIVTELLDPDTNPDPIPYNATSVDSLGIDSRSRTYGVNRYAGAVSLNETSNIFQQWNLPGGKDWKPVLRGVLGQDIVKKHELLARNIFLRSDQSRWTYAGGKTSFATLTGADKFSLEIVPDWKFRIGNTGSPVVPGDAAAAKVAIVAPGVTYDLRKSLATATSNEAQMFRDSRLYAGERIAYEIGEYSGVRFVEAPSDKYGMNPAVLYNCGVITKQYGVTERINAGDGAPNPETTKVDGIYSVGQLNVTHYLQLEDFLQGDFVVNDIVTIHVRRTSAYGVTNGVDPLDGTIINRRVVAVDDVNNRIVFDRPVFTAYNVPQVGKSVTGNVEGTFYAWVTKGRSIGMTLVLGSRGGVLGATIKPLRFIEPKAVDQFETMWRFSYDMWLGHNVWEPNLFEVHFSAVSLPKPGGVIAP